MQDDTYTIKSGHLDVGDGHQIYFQEWGNPESVPIFFLHGGPGGSCEDSHKLYFDPIKHHVIFHDQRGSGQSTPFGSTEHNNTQDLVEDINKLRDHIQIKGKHSFFGGSWGSCLALVYAISYPDNVKSMVLRGIYTGTKTETDYIQQGGIGQYYPETWERYIELVPEERRNDTVNYYLEQMSSNDTAVADEHIRRWVQNEVVGASIDTDIKRILTITAPIADTERAIALLEAHYFANNCFIEDEYILKNASKLKGINITLVQGRHDHICTPETAYALAKAIGDNCYLHIVPGAHSGSEGTMREVLRAYVVTTL